uniref:NMDA receptor synaptonuclear signaling and neuronal migration factor b n=1 Tax=Echeneis naucrates TaxID=173247 RepID=A0A665UYX5_ECHNA
MGTAVSKRKNLRSDAISSVAAKVRAARAFGDYLANTNPENRNGADHLLSETFPGQDCESPDVRRLHNNNLPPQSCCLPVEKPSQSSQSNLSAHPQPLVSTLPAPASSGPSKRRLSVERSLSAEDPPGPRGPEGSVAVKPARVYTITREGGMTLGGRGTEESLELEVLKGSRDHHHRGSHHRSNTHHNAHQHHGGPATSSQPLQSAGNTSNIRDWGVRRGGSRDDCTPDCVACIRAPCQSQRSLDQDTSPRDGGKHKRMDRMYSEERPSNDDREDTPNSWFPKENMFSFQTATTTMQAAFRGIAERKRRKREQEAATMMERNFRKHLRMVGSRRMKAQTFAERRAKSFSRSWSDPTPVKPDSLHDSRDSGELHTSSGNLDEGLDEDADWEEEREMERVACEGEDFIPPKIMLISSKVPKAEYVPNIIRRDDPSIIPILYDHERATFDDILDEIEKKLTAYRKGCKIWNMLIFCQGGPGHLYLLKNKVATFAKVEKEEDMIQLMRPSTVEFKSPLELSAQGKEMIEMYFDFRLFRLWKSRQHSKLLDYDDLL